MNSILKAHLIRLDKDKIYKVIHASLKDTITQHGPITEKYLASATKRIAGQIQTLVHNLEQEGKNDNQK